MTAKRIIITGANTGLGFESAKALAAGGADVTLAVRSLEKGNAAVARIRQASPDAKVEVGRLDLADLSSVQDFADAQADRPKIDVLMNNAGLMLVPHRTLTSEGFEVQMGVNHLGHFALTGRLMPMMAPDARIVSLSSSAHRAAPRLSRGLNLTGRYQPMMAYGQSKLATLLFALELNRRLFRAGSSVISVAAHPGFASTELMTRDDNPGPLTRFTRFVTPFVAQSAVTAARSQIFAAVGAGVRGGSLIGPSLQFFGAPHVAGMNSAAADPANAAWLWETSGALTGVEFAGL